jgi:hypothetical protein
MLYCSITPNKITVSNAPIKVEIEEFNYLILTPEHLIEHLVKIVDLSQALIVVFGVLNHLQIKPNNVYICSIPYNKEI